MQRGGSHTCKGLAVPFYTLCCTNLNTSITHIRREHQAMGQSKISAGSSEQVILLIGEYDVPLAKASDQGYYEKMLYVVRGIHDYREDFYHAFLAGVFMGTGYIVKSNREHGDGRSDVTVQDYDGWGAGCGV